MANDTKKGLGMLVAGAALGVAAAVLSDKKKRDEVTAKVQDGINKGKKALEEGAKQLNQKKQEVKQSVEHSVDALKKEAGTVRNKAKETIDVAKEGAQRGVDVVKKEAEKLKNEATDTTRKLEKELTA